MNALIKKWGRILGLTPIYRIFFRPESALRQLGWINSVGKNSSVDANNSPIPWMTYSILPFLDQRLKKSFSVFEYGSGNSTLWLAERVGSVVSIEHDRDWFHKVSRDLPDNVSFHLRKSLIREVTARCPLEMAPKKTVTWISSLSRGRNMTSLSSMGFTGFRAWENALITKAGRRVGGGQYE